MGSVRSGSARHLDAPLAHHPGSALWCQGIIVPRNTSGARGIEARMKIEAMLWILVFILVALAFQFPKTRAFSLSAIGVAIVAIVVIVVLAKRGEPTALGAAAPPT